MSRKISIPMGVVSVRMDNQIVEAYKRMPESEAKILREEIRQLTNLKTKKYNVKN